MEDKLKKSLAEKINRMKEKLENSKKMKKTLSQELLEESNLNLIDVFDS